MYLKIGTFLRNCADRSAIVAIGKEISYNMIQKYFPKSCCSGK